MVNVESTIEIIDVLNKELSSEEKNEIIISDDETPNSDNVILIVLGVAVLINGKDLIKAAQNALNK